MSTEGPATYSDRFQLCAMLLPSVDKSSEGIFLQNFDLPSWLSPPRVVNIIRDVKGFRYTAFGHNDFCSVRLNGPI